MATAIRQAESVFDYLCCCAAGIGPERGFQRSAARQHRCPVSTDRNQRATTLFQRQGTRVGGAYWTLYDPKNSQVGSAVTSSDFALALPYSGNYVLVFQTGNNPAVYSNQVNTVSFTTNALTLGSPTTATIA